MAVLAIQLSPPIHSSSVHHDGKMLQEPPSMEPVKAGNINFKESEGLGLVIVKKICELLRASMDIESKPGAGTLVRIRFQLKQEPNKVS